MLGIIFIIIAYVLGSVCSAILVCKAMKLPDPRTEGSGNPGATNVLRVAGKQAAWITLAGDVLKGLIPVLLARLLDVHGFMLGLVALAAVIGHIFPAFYNFKGGKGVATAFGGIIGLSFAVGVIALVVWIIILAVTRYVSLASLCAAILSAICILFVNPGYFIPTAIITLLIIWKHMDNIQRLRDGTENKFSLNKYKDLE